MILICNSKNTSIEICHFEAFIISIVNNHVHIADRFLTNVKAFFNNNDTFK